MPEAGPGGPSTGLLPTFNERVCVRLSTGFVVGDSLQFGGAVASRFHRLTEMTMQNLSVATVGRKFIEHQMQPRKEIANWAVLKEGENDKFSVINWIHSHKEREKTLRTAVSCERYGKRKKTKRTG